MSQNKEFSQPEQNSQQVAEDEANRETGQDHEPGRQTVEESEAIDIIKSIEPDKEMAYYEQMLDRVIIHIDMDAYYAQVESSKHGIKEEEPMGVL